MGGAEDCSIFECAAPSCSLSPLEQRHTFFSACAAQAVLEVATVRARIEVERVWVPLDQAIHPCPTLTCGLLSSLMLRTDALRNFQWLRWISLHLKMRFVLNLSCMPARISLTASACFVLRTGVCTLLLIAIMLTRCQTILTGIAHYTGRPPVSPLHQGSVCFVH